MAVIVRVEVQNREGMWQPKENIVLRIVFGTLRQLLAKDALFALLIAEDVRHAPGCPESFQGSLRSLFYQRAVIRARPGESGDYPQLYAGLFSPRRHGELVNW